MRILLVKTSSLGDVVHNLPVASDIASAMPTVEIDWLVEEAYAAIPMLHPAVRRVVPIALRRWRTRWWQSDTRGELAQFLNTLRAVEYDAIVDTQGLIKSALAARAARGRRYGFDRDSAREPLTFLYDRTFHVPRDRHAVERNRNLAAQALTYTPAAAVDYAIRAPERRFDWLRMERYAVLIHATSARHKLWPEPQWIALGEEMAAREVRAVLPWGTTAERARSERLAAAIPGAVIPPALSVAEVASLLAMALFTTGVDTGLTHLSVALGVPTVGIYSATDPAKTGLYGTTRAVNVGGIGRSSDAADVLRALASVMP
jgi:heptosyltransferase I